MNFVRKARRADGSERTGLLINGIERVERGRRGIRVTDRIQRSVRGEFKSHHIQVFHGRAEHRRVPGFRIDGGQLLRSRRHAAVFMLRIREVIGAADTVQGPLARERHRGAAIRADRPDRRNRDVVLITDVDRHELAVRGGAVDDSIEPIDAACGALLNNLLWRHTAAIERIPRTAASRPRFVRMTAPSGW